MAQVQKFEFLVRIDKKCSYNFSDIPNILLRHTSFSPLRSFSRSINIICYQAKRVHGLVPYSKLKCTYRIKCTHWDVISWPDVMARLLALSVPTLNHSHLYSTDFIIKQWHVVCLLYHYLSFLHLKFLSFAKLLIQDQVLTLNVIGFEEDSLSQ